MRILILSNEVWNDQINGNNVISNWFEGMNAEFANIYCEPGTPYNKCCKRYYQITDLMMLKSLFCRVKAGKVIDINSDSSKTITEAEQEPKKVYDFFRIISGSTIRLLRELLWLAGQYDVTSLSVFIREFKPDVIFSERMATCKMLRLEKIVHSLCDVSFFAFTGDDEYSLKQMSFSPAFWINRFMVRRRLRKNVKFYKKYYTLSQEQALFYKKEFGCNCSILQKCGFIEHYFYEKEIHKPIVLIYAGKFYCNRWKVLSEIVRALKEINRGGQKIILHIYTKDKPTKKQNRLLNDGINSRIMGAVNQNILRIKYQESDVALHVESRDLKYRLATRYSYSTKIIDCLFSGCAVMAYCWNKHSGLTSLEREDAAICVSNYSELMIALNQIVDCPNYIRLNREKAFKCAMINHNKTTIQNRLLKDFTPVANKYLTKEVAK